MVARVGTESKNLVGPEQSGIAKVFHRELALLAKESVVCASQVQARKHLPPILPQYELAIKPRQRCRSAKSVCGGEDFVTAFLVLEKDQSAEQYQHQHTNIWRNAVCAEVRFASSKLRSHVHLWQEKKERGEIKKMGKDSHSYEIKESLALGEVSSHSRSSFVLAVLAVLAATLRVAFAKGVLPYPIGHLLSAVLCTDSERACLGA